MGFDCGRVDGLFGVETDEALRDFQRNVGLVADGTCGPATFKALNQLSARSSAAGRTTMRDSEAINRAGPTLSGKLVIVDPGHGGARRGAGRGLDRGGDLVYDLAARIEGRLTRHRLHGVPHPRPRRAPDGPSEESTGPASPTPPVPTC